MNRKKIGALILASSIGSQILNQAQIVSALENREINTVVHNEIKEESEEVKNIEENNVENTDSKDEVKEELEKEETDILAEEKINIESKSEVNENIISNDEKNIEEKVEKSNITTQNIEGFNFSDWQSTDNGTSIILTGYNGSDRELVIPGEYDGKQVLLDNLQIFPQNMTNLQILEVNGKKVKIDVDSNDDLKLYFKNYSSVRSMDLRGLDVSNLNSMGSMFANCSNLESLDITGWDVSNIKSFSYMFVNDSRLTDLKGIENLEVSSAVNMMSMFASIGVKELDLSNWNTSNVTNMSYMFNQTRNLESIDASTWDTSKVTDMSSMFINNDSLKIIDLSNWDTSNVTNMTKIFYVAVNGLKQNLLVVTKDEKLKNYDYAADNRLASGPVFSANGGTFSDKTTRKEGKKIYTVESLDNVDKEVEAIKNSMEIPTYVERVFVKWVKTPYDKPNDLLEVWDKLNSEYVAEWKINSYKVTFDSQGGSQVPEADVNFDELVKEPTVPTREGYTFEGWYKEPDCQNAWDFTTEKMPSNNVTLYAKWTINSYQVNFDSQGGTVVASETVEFEGKVTEPTPPTKEGYTFAGWYKEQSCTTPWDFKTDKMPASNITLYAKWTINSYKVTFDSQGGSNVPEADVNFDELVKEPTAPTREGYTFGGWYKEPDCQNAWDFATEKMPSNNVILYAKWTMNSVIINSVPTINAEDKVLTVGDEFNPLEGVTAFDNEDGEITLTEANIIANDVDMRQAGTYSIKYKVTDKQGALSLKTITVIVNPKIVTINEAPVIFAEGVTIEIGSKFAPLKNVKAQDNEDGDITEKIKVIENTVNTNKPGIYSVTYEVTDNNGSITRKTIVVIVKEKQVNGIDKNTIASNSKIKVVITEITNSNNISRSTNNNSNEGSEVNNGLTSIKSDLGYNDHIHDEKCIIHWLLLLLSAGMLISSAVSKYRFNKKINEDNISD